MMNLRLSLFCLALLAPQPLFALPAGAPARVDAVVKPYADAGMFNGVVLISEGNAVPVVKTYGMANYELGVPIARSTTFQIGSISKPITDAGLAVLLDRGRMSLDTKVSDLLPAFPRGAEITVKHILEQNSGIPHTNVLPEYDGSRMTLARSVEILATKPLDYDPGTKSAYSNGAYDVLAAMIEKASGTPFQQFIRNEVLDRLGMKQTGFAATYAVIPGMADGYIVGSDPGTRSRSRFYAVENRPGGGAMYSTADDILKFFRAASGGKFTGPANTALLFGEPGKQYQPMGRNPGYSAVIFTDAAKDIYVVTLANNGASLDSFGRRLYQAAIGEPAAADVIRHAPRKLSRADAAYFDGMYKWEGRPSAPFRIYVDPDGDLVIENSENDYRAALYPIEGGRWFHTTVDGTCSVEGQKRAEAFVCISTLKNRQQNPFKMVRAD